jgi:allophanate hydrolase subunit 2
MATTRNWKRQDSGERQEETEWHRVVFYDRLAEIAGEYLKKGRPVYVEGRLKTRKWQDKDGKDNYTTESWPSRCNCWAAVKAHPVPRRQRLHPPRSRPPASTTWTTTFRSDRRCGFRLSGGSRARHTVLFAGSDSGPGRLRRGSSTIQG